MRIAAGTRAAVLCACPPVSVLRGAAASSGRVCTPLAHQAPCATARPRARRARRFAPRALRARRPLQTRQPPCSGSPDESQHLGWGLAALSMRGTHGAPEPPCRSAARAGTRAPARAGSTQDSTRVWRALALGCIPVTFFRAAELPFARRLGLDYTDVTVNVQPDDYRGLQARARARPARRRAGGVGRAWARAIPLPVAITHCECV